MWLDLSKIIEIPGAEKPFELTLSTDGLDFTGVKCFISPPHASGKAVNTAGLLSLRGAMECEMVCICDRCGREFNVKKVQELNVPLSADVSDEDNPDIYPLEGDGIDLEQVLFSCFTLDMDTKFLCKSDCKGLCPTCGKDLNDGPCGCEKPKDPRMAVLGQLLDIDE